jgi:peroxiredoxin
MLLFTLFMQTSQATEYCTEGNAEIREACLREKIAQLERANREPTQEEEEKARELFSTSQEARQNNDTERAKSILLELEKTYPHTRTYQRAKRVLNELKMFGTPMPDVPELKWLQGSAPEAMGQSGLTIFIFWEVWCPHCKREVPAMNTTFETYSERGLQVVGLTKLTRGRTEDEVQAFLSEKGISFPIAKDEGELSYSFKVSGIPAAAVAQNGTVIWRGHPAMINDTMIEEWLGDAKPSESTP